MTSNPIKNHVIGATGCDGSILGFLGSRHTRFKYASRYTEFARIYRLLLDVSCGNNPQALPQLIEEVKQLESFCKMSNENMDEAALVCDTLKNALTKISEQIDEQIATEHQNKKL